MFSALVSVIILVETNFKEVENEGYLYCWSKKNSIW